MSLIIKQTRMEITNYDIGDCPVIENTFRLFDPLYHKYFYKGIYYDENRRILYLPRGIDIRWVENKLGINAIYDPIPDEFDILEDPIMLKYLPRDDVQKEALRFMIGVEEFENVKTASMLSVNLNTGKGKTYCSIATMAWLNMRSMVITSTIGWLNQWKDFILEYTNIKKDEIYYISGAASIQKLFKRDASKYKVILVSHNTIKSYGDNYGWNKVGELFLYLKIGIKFYDEAHLNFENMCMIDFHTNTFKTYYVTATPSRSNEGEDRIFQFYFKNIPSIDLFDQDNDPRTQYIAFRYNSRPDPMEVSRCKNQYGLDRNKYTNYVVDKENFHYMLHILIDKIKRINGKVLIYVGTNEAILIIKDWIIGHYPDLKSKIGIYTSLITDNKEEQMNKKIILSTTKSCGAAVDIKGLRMTIVLAEPFKSHVLARQTLGRTRDRNTSYIEIVDDGFFYTNKFYMYKQPIFEKYATKCSEVVLSDSEIYNKANNLFEAYQQRIIPGAFQQPGDLIIPGYFE